MPSIRTASERHAYHFAKRLEALDGTYLSGGDGMAKALAGLDLDLQNIMAGQRWAAATAARSALGLSGNYSKFSANLLSYRLRPAEHLMWLKHGLRSALALKDRHSTVTQLIALGHLYWEMGNLNSCGRIFRGAIRRATKLGLSAEAREALAGLGFVHEAQGETKAATTAFIAALESSKLECDRDTEAVCLLGLGSCLWNEDRLREAIRSYTRALELFRQCSDPMGEASVLNNLGSIFVHIGHPRRGIVLLLSALDIVRVFDPQGGSEELGNLGWAYEMIGNHAVAIAYHEQALGISRQYGNRMNEAQDLCGLGRAHLLAGSVEVALRMFHQSIEAAGSAGDAKTVAEAFVGLAKAFDATGRLPDAESAYTKALQLWRSMENRTEELTVLNAIDEMHRRHLTAEPLTNSRSSKTV